MAINVFVAKLIKDNAWVFNENKIQQVLIKGNLRLSLDKLAIGDYVVLEQENEHQVIKEVLPRKNFVIRPKIANIDRIIIIQSAIEPNFNSLLLDEMIVFYELQNIKVAIAFSKLDLIDSNHEIFKYINDYKSIGYEVYCLNDEQDFGKMIASFDNQIICFAGNSGVGKSTLINRIDPTLKLMTQETSKSLNRGKHTTTNTSIIKVNNFYLVDTPGFSTISISTSPINIAHIYFQHEAKEPCKFNDCLHNFENQCYIKKLLDENKINQWRYNNYLNILKRNKEVK